MEELEISEIFEQLRAAQNLNSCIPGTPFIRTADGIENPPPALHYNMEQAAGFSAYGVIRFSPDDIPYSLFNEDAKTPPPNNILILNQTLENEEFINTITDNPYIVPNTPLVKGKKNFNPITTPPEGSEGTNNNLLGGGEINTGEEISIEKTSAISFYWKNAIHLQRVWQLSSKGRYY